MRKNAKVGVARKSTPLATTFSLESALRGMSPSDIKIRFSRSDASGVRRLTFGAAIVASCFLAGCDSSGEGSESFETAGVATSSSSGGASATGRPSGGGAEQGQSGSGGGRTAPSSGGTGGRVAEPEGRRLSCETWEASLAQERSFAPLRFSQGQDASADPSCTDVLNPGRGFFTFHDMRNLGSLAGIRDSGRTLIYGKILIDDYRNTDLSAELLSELADAFSAVRAAGLQVLPRFYYADNGTAPDAELEQVLTHIRQLESLLEENADVIAALHAGFVGAWGEWHASSNNLTEPSARQAIFDELLDVLPASRMVLARRPSHKSEAYGGPLTEETAFSESRLARLGHLNDCFLASDNDFGTYQLAGEKDFAEADSEFVAVGGETCAVNPPRSECLSALAELELHHFSFLNQSYHEGVIDSWRSGECFAEIACRLGYRLLLLKIEGPESVDASDELPLRIQIENDGFSRIYQERVLDIVLRGENEYRVLTDVDLRDVRGAESTEICLSLRLPDGISPGNYEVLLAAPDLSPSLSMDPRYSIRFANLAWDPERGLNETGFQFEVR